MKNDRGTLIGVSYVYGKQNCSFQIYGIVLVPYQIARIRDATRKCPKPPQKKILYFRLRRVAQNRNRIVKWCVANRIREIYRVARDATRFLALYSVKTGLNMTRGVNVVVSTTNNGKNTIFSEVPQ